MEALDKKNLYHDVGGCGANATSWTGVQDPISSLHYSISGAGTLRYHCMYVLYKTIKAVLRWHRTI